MSGQEKPPRRRRILKQFSRPQQMNRADWIALVVTAFLVGMVLYPVFAKRPRVPSDHSCASNLKMIGIGLLSYTQDYDDRLPVAVSSAFVGGVTARRNWAVDTAVPGVDVKTLGLLSTYEPRGSRHSVFEDPYINAPASPLTYMYNDLAAASRLFDFARPAQTVVVVDGEALLDNVGHAWEPKREQRSNGATYNAQGRCDPGQGAFVTEDATTRHQSGANYAFADGHVKWFKPGNVYFPSRASASPSHRDAASGALSGPEPGGNMKWNGRAWAGTFHLR